MDILKNIINILNKDISIISVIDKYKEIARGDAKALSKEIGKISDCKIQAITIGQNCIQIFIKEV